MNEAMFSKSAPLFVPHGITYYPGAGSGGTILAENEQTNVGKQTTGRSREVPCGVDGMFRDFQMTPRFRPILVGDGRL
jgi:hypothetical protein